MSIFRARPARRLWVACLLFSSRSLAQGSDDIPSGTDLLCRLQDALDPSLMKTYGSSDMMEQRYGRCAVISSSGVMLQHNYGAEIDEADMILRFNDAATDTFEYYVGSRTTFRTCNDIFPGKVHEGAVEMDQDICYIMIPGSKENDTDALYDEYPDCEMHAIEENLSLVATEVIQELYPPNYFSAEAESSKSADFTDRWKLTTGTMGVLVALSICDEVWLYAMTDGPHEAIPGTRDHYYDGHGSKTYHFSWNAEKNMLRRIAYNGEEEINRTDVAKVKGFKTACEPSSSGLWGSMHAFSPRVSLIFVGVCFAVLFVATLATLACTRRARRIPLLIDDSLE